MNLVRWGARVVACLSPPAFGCLWVLAEGLLDYAAQKVAETCWFQEKIKPLLLKIGYVTTELPNKLADGLIARIKFPARERAGRVRRPWHPAGANRRRGRMRRGGQDRLSGLSAASGDRRVRSEGRSERAHAMSLLAHKMDGAGRPR